MRPERNERHAQRAGALLCSLAALRGPRGARRDERIAQSSDVGAVSRCDQPALLHQFGLPSGGRCATGSGSAPTLAHVRRTWAPRANRSLTCPLSWRASSAASSA